MKICPYALTSIKDLASISNNILFDNLCQLKLFIQNIEFADEWADISNSMEETYSKSFVNEFLALADIILCKKYLCGRYNECCAGKEEDE